ncbi:MAG: hypothetical protein GY805_21895 [Chloroflexi bacterium]|nr:hypothetical protein [Chloroflexota bacterium]
MGAARTANRHGGNPRGLIFIGGDLHSGGLFDIQVADPEFTAPCLISSGISEKNKLGDPLIGILVDEEFEVSDGIHASLKNFVNSTNFGVVHVVPTGSAPFILPTVANQGNAFAWGLKIG